MEQLIIFLLFVVGSIVSSIIQKKRQAEAERREQGLPSGSEPPLKPSSDPMGPIGDWPKTAQDWQEQLKRMLEGKPLREQSKPPIVIKPVLLPKDKPHSKPPASRPPIISTYHSPEGAVEGQEFKARPISGGYQRAKNLHANVENSLRAADPLTAARKPASFERSRPRGASAIARRLRRDRDSVRDAFVASIIFAPPKALENLETESVR